jgi:hypothetical protein
MVPRRRECSPAILAADRGVLPLERIPLTQTQIKEHVPQELIRCNPDLLPVAELDPTFAPLITIGWEVDASPAGSIDVLCINPDGRLTIVETKLWRNPQALRDVVSQMIDYASQVSRWSYEDLEQRVIAYNRKYRNSTMGLFETVVQATGDQGLDEARFVDRVTAHLRRGRMVLAVAGDGIRERLEDIRRFLEMTPELHFKFMLVEMHFYKLPMEEGGILVVPQLVTRSREVERTVFDIRIGDPKMATMGPSRDVTVEARPTKSAKPKGANPLHKLEGEDREFVEGLLAEVQDLGVCPTGEGRDVMLKLPNARRPRRKATLLKINPVDHTLYEDHLPRQLIEQYDVPLEEAVAAARDYYQAVIDLFPGREMPMDREGHGEAWKPYLPISTAMEKETEFRDVFRRTVERIVALVEKAGANTDAEE